MKAKKIIAICAVIAIVYAIVAIALRISYAVHDVIFMVDDFVYFESDTAKISFPDPPQKEGLYFYGWFVQTNNGEIQVTTSYFDKRVFTSDVLLYAKWTESITDIYQYDTREATFSKVIYSEDLSSNIGSTSDSDYTNLAIKNSSSEILHDSGSGYPLYIIWCPNASKITVAHGKFSVARLSATNIMKLLVEYAIAEKLAKAGYTFNGFSASPTYDVADPVTDVTIIFDNATESTFSGYTVFVNWIPNQNKLVYDGNGADSGVMEDGVFLSDTDKHLDLNAYGKEGFTFSGWGTSKNGIVEYLDGALFNIGVEPIVKLYAVWAFADNTLIFKSEMHSSTEKTVSVAPFSDYSLPSDMFKAEKYILTGWRLDDTFYPIGSSISLKNAEKHVLVATWELDSYAKYSVKVMIEKLSENGYALMKEASYDSKGLIGDVLSVAPPIFEHYDFNPELSITETAIDDSGATEILLYYTRLEYNVVFVANGGIITDGTDNLRVSALSNVEPPTIKRDGYMFAGWDYTTNCIYYDCYIGAVWEKIEKPKSVSLVNQQDNPIVRPAIEKQNYNITQFAKIYFHSYAFPLKKVKHLHVTSDIILISLLKSRGLSMSVFSNALD
ncbi:MAG: InlB B-repeat-containing protein [Christensenellaceae bacterium]|nr:InlB B-repeat-containing protein [Christensenellaceae bacterium]